MATTAPTTIFESVRDEVAAVASALERKAERGTPRREFTNGLLRDLYVVQQMALEDKARFDDADFVAPFVEQFLAKLALAPGLFPEAGAQVKSATDKVRQLLGERQGLTMARELARPVFDDAVFDSLHEDARAKIEAERLPEAFIGESGLRARGDATVPPDVAVVARFVDALAIHRAHILASPEGALAKGDGADENEAAIEKAQRELEAWLEGRGCQAERPAVGTPSQPAHRAIPGRKNFVGAVKGAVGALAGAGFAFGGKVLNRATVVVSPGAQAHVASAANALLAGAADANVLERALPTLRSLEANVRRIFDDPAAKMPERAGSCLNLIEALHPLGILADPKALAALVEAFGADFPGEKADLLVPLAGQRLPAGYPADVKEVWSYDIAPGIVVEISGLGLRLGDKIVRKAGVLVSKGPPPAGAVDEIIQLLPEGELGDAYRERLKRSRTREEELARALAELIVEGRHQDLTNAAQRAMKALLDTPPAALAEVEGWQECHDFLDKHLDALIDDGQEGQRVAHRLLRPYLQSLVAGRIPDARLRSLAESLTSVLGLYGEDVTQVTRAYVFGELSKLRAGALEDSSSARRLARAVAHGMRLVSTGDNPAAARDLVQALAAAGIQVFPAEGDRLGLCPNPDELFHRLELRHDDTAPRGKILGAIDAAVKVGKSTETGGLAISLGPLPKVLPFLRGDAMASSRLRPALAKLEAKVVELEQARFRAELKGDATADRAFATEVSKFLSQLLKEVGWSRAEADRETMGALFAVLKDDWKIDLLPGYLTYRQLRALQEQHGEKVKVTIQEAPSREVVLESIGSIFRDEVLSPLVMVWKVGKAPPYVASLKQLDWFKAVLDGKPSPLKMGPRVQEAILDFQSPDAGSVDGVVRSLQIVVTWLAAEHAAKTPPFLDIVKNAPGLELDFFPLPGSVYPREVILKAVDDARSPIALGVSVDATKQDGEAVTVPQIAVYREGKRLSEEPKATFALKTASPAYDGFSRALEPCLKSADVQPSVKEELQGQRTKIALLAPGPATLAVEVEAFKTLHRAHLIDPQYPTETPSAVHKIGAYLTGNLTKGGALKVERFEGARKIADLQAPEKGLVVSEEFCIPGMPEVLSIERPLVQLKNQLIQSAFVRKGVPSSEEEVVNVDRVLNDAFMRLRAYAEGPGAVVEAALDDKEQTILPRTIKRIEEVRGKMLELHKASKKALPSKTSLRDLAQFIIDQIHRYDDALALLDDRTHRAVYSDQVFKDVIFRSAGPYLSQTHGISIDTSVVAGSDVSVLTGKYKKETTGPKPKRVNNIIFSVVVPAYNQSGTCIRPATVRVGEY